ncbi:MAG: SAM-dependent methyltransferase [Actinomycetota bacterium]
MRALRSDAVQRVVRAFSDSRPDQLHLLLRAATCPVAPILGALPPGGTVLDVGCGHGLVSLLAALDDPRRQVVGTDLDTDKLERARQAADRLGLSDRVRFVEGHDGSLPLDALPAGGAAAVLCVDVLYLLGIDRAEALLRAMADAVRPGGVVVVKEMSLHPAWKRRLLETQEFVATRVVGWTEGERVVLVPPGRMVDVLAGAGLQVRTERLDRRSPHPHLLVVATRPDT